MGELAKVRKLIEIDEISMLFALCMIVFVENDVVWGLSFACWGFMQGVRYQVVKSGSPQGREILR